MWVPSHSGVARTKIADSAAKDAINSPITSKIEIYVHLDLRHFFKNKIMNKCNETEII